MIEIDINNKKDCCGCTACSSVCPKNCITMAEDNEGFLYPSVDAENCIDCGMCEKVCPIKKEIPSDSFQGSFVARIDDDEVLMNSSSGGAFTALSRFAIGSGFTVYGGAYNECFDVVHESAKTNEEAKKFRGSKYVQSFLGDTFRQIKSQLNKGEKVLFSGTPCQCAGLISYLGKPYDNLITVDFVCHAVPSPKVWSVYRDYLNKKYKSKIKDVNFRSKVYGYHCSSIKIDMENGKSQKLGLNTDMFLKSFFFNVSCRPSCYECHFKTVDRVCDITVFDCWNITRFVPDKKDDDRGYSAVIVHSKKGAAFFEKASSCLEVHKADLDTLIKYDGKYAVKSIDYTEKREEYFRLINEGLPIDEVTKRVIPIKTKNKLMGKTKGFLHATGLMKLAQKLK